MPFYEIEFPLAALNSEAVEAALQELGAHSITYLDRGDEPVLEPRPGEFKLWSDTLVRALFDGATDPGEAFGRLAARFGAAVTDAARLRPVADQAWERAWLVDWKSRRFGPRLWVCPTTAEAPAGDDALVVRLDPGLAFGTGTHPTTALCLEALAELDLAGKSVVDYGSGSGILAIAALKLGARMVTAVDLDPQALLASRENAERNGVAASLVTQSPASSITPADCVIANILAGILIELRPVLTAACKAGGELLLSGVLQAQSAAVAKAYAPWFDMVTTVTREDWCCLRARRRAPPGSAGVT
jgi:ribosomal protein L11 methyltransferase